MSYDVRLEVDAGGQRRVCITEWRSPTYNLGPMFREALGRSMRCHGDGPSLDGMLARDALPVIESAIAAMRSDPARFKALNPPNGWGDYDSALRFLEALADDCRLHPLATVRA